MDHFKEHWSADLQQRVLDAAEETVRLFYFYCFNLGLIYVGNHFHLSLRNDTLKCTAQVAQPRQSHHGKETPSWRS